MELYPSVSMQYLMNATSSHNLIKIGTNGLLLENDFTAIMAAGYGVLPDTSTTVCTLYLCMHMYGMSVKNSHAQGLVGSNRRQLKLLSEYRIYEQYHCDSKHTLLQQHQASGQRQLHLQHQLA